MLYFNPPNGKLVALEWILRGTNLCGAALLTASERKKRVDRPLAQDHTRQFFAQRRPVFVSVPRTAAGQPDVLRLGMAVEKEMLVRRVFVLANASFKQRRSPHSGESEFHILPGVLKTFGRRQTLALRGVECLGHVHRTRL